MCQPLHFRRPCKTRARRGDHGGLRAGARGHDPANRLSCLAQLKEALQEGSTKVRARPTPGRKGDAQSLAGGNASRSGVEIRFWHVLREARLSGVRNVERRRAVRPGHLKLRGELRLRALLEIQRLSYLPHGLLPFRVDARHRLSDSTAACTQRQGDQQRSGAAKPCDSSHIPSLLSRCSINDTGGAAGLHDARVAKRSQLRGSAPRRFWRGAPV